METETQQDNTQSVNFAPVKDRIKYKTDKLQEDIIQTYQQANIELTQTLDKIERELKIIEQVRVTEFKTMKRSDETLKLD